MTTDPTRPPLTGKSSHFSWRARIRSFRYAFAGTAALMTEHNAWLHAVAAVAAITLGIVLHISATEWCAVTICIGMVFAMEAVNTALEALCDHVSPQFAPMIKRAKDTAAAAVLITAIAALAVGLIIFIPRIL